MLIEPIQCSREVRRKAFPPINGDFVQLTVLQISRGRVLPSVDRELCLRQASGLHQPVVDVCQGHREVCGIIWPEPKFPEETGNPSSRLITKPVLSLAPDTELVIEFS